MVSLLKTTASDQQTPNVLSPSESLLLQRRPSRAHEAPQTRSGSDTTSVDRAQQRPPVSRYSQPFYYNTGIPEPSDKAQPGVFSDDPDALLALYRDEMAPQFPFVIVPQSLSASELHVKKPFLLKVMVTVASLHDVAAQTAMCKEIVTELSKKMLIDAKMSLDMLQGLLVFIAWYDILNLNALP